MKKAAILLSIAAMSLISLTSTAQTPWWTRGNSTYKNAGLSTNHQLGTEEAVPLTIITNNTARATFSASGKVIFTTDSLYQKKTGGTQEQVVTTNSVATVSPTSPNRTIKVVIGTTTLYIPAKTTND